MRKRFLNRQEAIEKFRLVTDRLLETFVEKSADYGVRTFQHLGSRGIFADINRKYWRLKELVWKRRSSKSKESVADTWLDMAVYSIFGIILNEIECSRKNQKLP